MWNAQPAEFLSTPSARRATPPGQVQQIRHVDFYPRPPRGGRRAQGSGRAAERNFYPRPPRGGRPSSGALPGPALKISIHALREEGDGSAGVGRSIELISIHALREEGDPFSRRTPGNNTRFLSTPSARRATDEQFVLLLSHGISIHALREEGDPGLVRHHPYDHISIHALREEGDIAIIVEVIFEPDFYPRPPRGGRPASGQIIQIFFLFLSTPSARRATPVVFLKEKEISIFLSTPSARRATPGSSSAAGRTVHFYPRPPRGGRLDDTAAGRFALRFLSTPSARRATPTSWALVPFA